MKRVLKPQPFPMFQAPVGKTRMFDPTFGGAFQNINGVPVPVYFNQGKYEQFRKTHVTAHNDVFFLGYPKTGNHLLKKLMLEMMKNCRETKDCERYQTINLGIESVPFFDLLMGSDKDYDDYYAATKDHVRLHWTHCDFNNFPAKELHKDTKIIYILRNPKDTFLSICKFFPNLWFLEYEGDGVKNGYLDQWLQGLAYYGDYFEHVLSWYRAKHDIDGDGVADQIHFVYYEDLVRNSVPEIEKIVEFLKLTPMDGDESVRAIADKIKFKNVVQELKQNPGNFHEDLGLSVEQYFRKGEVGSSAKELSADDLRRIDRKTYVKFADLDIKYWTDVNQSLFEGEKKSEYVE